MRSRSRGRRRSVDKGTCGPGIEPRKNLTPGRRRCKEMRKAPSGAPISRGATESRAVTDPEHVRKHLEREPGDPRFAQGCRCPGTHREVEQTYCTGEVPEQRRATGSGGDGGKRPGQREPAPTKRVPDTEPGRRAQCVGAVTSSSKEG